MRLMYIDDRRPTNDLTFGKFKMAISARVFVRSISCLVLWWGFRGRRIKWRYFRFRQIQDGGAVAAILNPRWRRSSRHLEKFKWRYLRGGSSDLLRV